MRQPSSAANATDPLLTQSWTYDSVDNMTWNSAVGAYSYPAPGTPRPHGVTSTPLGSYVYDASLGGLGMRRQHDQRRRRHPRL